MDTYVGCSHNCKYCYKTARSNHIARNFNDIKPLPSVKGVKDFINGKRNLETMCFNWDIPLHWGANSDPFQECEKEFHASLDVLKVFAETKYPFIVSTKNPVLLTEEPYLSTISECECVLQISMACSKYDKLEKGAPTYKERLKAAETLSKHVTRVVARVQPYFIDCKKEIIKELPNMAKAGIHGIIIQGYISNKKRKGMEKVGVKYRFQIGRLARDYKQIREECHKVGLAFTCTEYGLDWMSDDIKCCGTAGLNQYKPNNFTLARLCYAPNLAIPSETMMQKGTTRPFKSVRMTQAWALELKNKSYYDMIMSYEPSNTAYCLKKREKYG
jgi:DNA repair photolyase